MRRCRCHDVLHAECRCTCTYNTLQNENGLCGRLRRNQNITLNTELIGGRIDFLMNVNVCFKNNEQSEDEIPG
jgi:hypothetical protein